MTDSQSAGRADDAAGDDVAEEEAEAIAKEISAKEFESHRLTAPATDEPSDDTT